MLLFRQVQPVADEFLDRDRHVEEVLQDRLQPFGVARLQPEAAGEMQLRHVGHGIAVAQRIHAQADQGSDVGGKAVGLRPVEADRGLRAGPGPVEQAEHAMVEGIGEADEGRVAVVSQPVARILGHVQRQRPVRPEQPQEVTAQPIGPPVLPRTVSGQGRRRETQRDLLAQPERIVRRAHRFPHAGFVAIDVLQSSDRLEEPEPVRLLLQSRDQLYSL